MTKTHNLYYSQVCALTAARRGDVVELSSLFKSQGSRVLRSDNEDTFFAAVSAGKPEAVKFILDNAQDEKKLTPSVLAIALGIAAKPRIFGEGKFKEIANTLFAEIEKHDVHVLSKNRLCATNSL